MEREKLLAMARESVDAWNRGDADGTVANVADDIVHHDGGLGMDVHGKAELRDLAQRYMTAFPDLHVEITSTTCEADRLVQEWVATGTHEGELMGMAPTHRHVEFRGCAVGEIGQDGLEHRSAQYWEALALMNQLGVSPATAGAAGQA
jgi:steroid delta-isomerase-like uncharacterized protein